MKLKPTLIALAVTSAISGSVLAQTSTSKTENQAFTQFNRTGVVTAWGRGITGQGVRVAVIDSGFDLTHTDLRGQVAGAKNFNPASLAMIANNTNNIRSQLQGGYDIMWGLHGTQMASIVAGRLDNNAAVGVAHGSQLLLAQIGEGARYNTTTKTWAFSDAGISITAANTALTWAEANGATAANMSFGSTFDTNFRNGVKLVSPGVYQAPSNYNRASATNPCFAAMYGNCLSDLNNFANASKNLVLVAAAGNQGLPYAQFPGAFATQVDKNGNLVLGGRVLIVGSVNANNVISSFSNRAGSLCTNLVGTTCNDKYYVKDFFVVAPGEAIIASRANQTLTATQIQTTGLNQVSPATGTSPATAYVTGGVALIKQAWPQLTAAQIVHLVKTTATDLTINPVTKKHDDALRGVDEIYGWGLVNFDRATAPSGALTVSRLSASLRPGEITVNSTGVMTSGSINLTTSSVLKSVQTIDSIGRHYTVDFTRATAANRIATYQYGSAWLALSPVNYREHTVPVTMNHAVKMMSSASGNAMEVQKFDNNIAYNLQIGSMTEQQGFLGNYGSGAMQFGNSKTDFAQAGINYRSGNVIALANYGLGVTRVGSVQDSMIQLNRPVVSESWRVGIGFADIFKSNDQITVSALSPVAVRRGSAQVTAVTGYEFTEQLDGSVDSKSIIGTETVNLRGQVRPMDLVIGYSFRQKDFSRLTVNIARQYNVGGQAGNTAYGVGVVGAYQF
jgi:subtilisin family serine protease